jgi:hypothetical protein
MRIPTPRSAVLAIALIAATAPAAGAEVVRVVATDANGVTLRIMAEAWSLTPPSADGRVRIVGVPEAHSLADPGHALLPAYSATLAVPPDARPSLRVVSASVPTVRGGVRLEIAGRPEFLPPATEGGQFEPAMAEVTPLLDGPWPAERAVLGTVSPFRGRRLVSFEVRPFQYDEASGELRVTTELVLRVDFNRPGAAAALPAMVTEPDPHADDVLRSAVLNFDQAAPWRVAPRADQGSLFGRAVTPAAAAALGFDEFQPEVRVTIDSTGLWLLPYDQLAANGYPAGTPVGQVSLHRHEFAEGQTLPYGTVELPIEVEDANGNGTFDSGDRIWAYVRNWADRASPSRYQRWWGDAEVVYATVKPAGGARVTSRQGWRGASAPSQLTSYPQFRHWERNFAIIMPFINAATDTSLDIYHWTNGTFYYDRQDTIQFTANSLDTTHTIAFATNWMGRAYGPHNDFAAVKNKLGQLTTVADSIVWFDKLPVTASANINGSALSEGVNRFVAWGKSSPAAPNPTTNYRDNSGLDWFELTYWRRYDAVHDVLTANTGTTSGEVQMHFAGFLADSMRAYDVSDPENPVRLVVDESHIQRASTLSFDLQDSIVAGQRRSYVAAVAQEPLDPDYGPRVPAADHFARVTRRQLYSQGAADYLVVCPEAFLGAIQPLVSLRQAQGLRVLVTTAEDVYDVFNGGRHSAWALRRLSRFAYDKWNTRFLLLVGDGTLDPMNYGRISGRDWIPVNPVPGPVRVGEGYEVTVSDNLYGFLTGNADPITTFGDVIPELMIGRLPVNSAAEAATVVAKIVGNETLAGNQDWRRHLLLCSDDAFSSDAFSSFGSAGPGYCYKDYEMHFLGLNQKIRSIVLRDAGLGQMDVENWNLRYYLANEPWTSSGAAGDTCRLDRTATRNRTHAGVTPLLFSHLNSGTLWWNYQGHANEYVLTHEDLYINSGDAPGSDDKFLFNNTDRPLFYTAFSCHANMFARAEGGTLLGLGGCLGEDMVTLPQRGAVASWASCCYEVVPRDDSSHINVELARAMFSNPPRDNQLWDHGSRVVLGEVVQAAFLRFLPTVTTYPSERGIAVTYTLLGDPATRLSIGRPQSLVYANDSLVTDGLAIRLHSPGDTLTLVGDLVSTARLDSVGLWLSVDGGPDQPVPASEYTLSPAFPDTAGGGTYGGRRFRLVHGTHLPAQTRRYSFRALDRDGLATTLAAQFTLDATLRVDGTTIHDGDDVSPVANLSAYLVSPAPLAPDAEVTVTVNGAAQAFTATAAPGDASGREWILALTHAPFAKDNYVVVLTVRGSESVTRRFSVSTATGELRIANLYAFPNPFDNDGTAFSFQLQGSDPADVRISLFTISGRRIWSQDWKALPPGYHQLPWDARDGDGDELANGVYVYRLSAATAAGRHAEQLGRLVKLRKPRHVDLPVVP